MSYASHLDLLLSHEDFFTDHIPGAQVVESNGEALGSKGRVMSHQEQEALGMRAATMKVMAAPATEILREASAACTRIMHVAQALERRGNAQCCLNRKQHPLVASGQHSTTDPAERPQCTRLNHRLLPPSILSASSPKSRLLHRFSSPPL
ncbi:hypothetical protein C8R44DRAFT_727434 [Mycena epipterygia]|nr:hypothetical protein C8R44DRAFT_727434 [Mycena epipterygia]